MTTTKFQITWTLKEQGDWVELGWLPVEESWREALAHDEQIQFIAARKDEHGNCHHLLAVRPLLAVPTVTIRQEEIPMTEPAIVPHPARRSITAAMAERYGMAPEAFEATLRATVIPSGCTREQFAAFLLVAKEYGLNPLTKEIYAFPAKGGGIQPVVSVDGWANLVNSHPAADGFDFHDTVNDRGELVSITCRMHRKDRAFPIQATEYMAECFRQTEPWQKWPRRMLRHKALIQAARYAFGFAGIVDPDEGERFSAEIARDVTPRRALKDRLDAIAESTAAGPAASAAAVEEGAEGESQASPSAPDPDPHEEAREHLLAMLRPKALQGSRALQIRLRELTNDAMMLLTENDMRALDEAAALADAKGAA